MMKIKSDLHVDNLTLSLTKNPTNCQFKLKLTS